MSVTINSPRDPCTLSNYNNWRTTHTTISLEVLFDQQIAKGNVIHKLESITDAESQEIILDTSHLEIFDVQVDGSKHEYDLAPWFKPFGSPLKVKLAKGIPKGKSIDLSIDFATTASCTALQWLTPAQTSNKKHPYLFSQCQAIHARSVFPCQDTPDVKATFDFKIKSPLHVIASGLPSNQNPVGPSSNGEMQLYEFHQAVPIPSYLFAIASGDIDVASIGPRSKVATGPNELKDCQWELERDMEKFMDAAESLVYKYAWGEYNVLVLPPSFPYGGMENPVYTFATPTIISGDRQNVDVVAHELAHSWSGNLVSCASFEHFWLNEGWTVYLERRIMAVIHGGDEWRDFSAIIGWKELAEAVAKFGDTHKFTRMIVDLKGHDPDDAFSTIPYEKGFTFLYYIEKLIGIDSFNKFIPHYFETWRSKSLDSYDFKATLLDFFAKDTDVSAKLKKIDWDTWFYKPGMPPKPDFNTSLVDGVYKLADKWETFTKEENPSFVPTPKDIEGWTANQVVVFLQRVMDFEKPLPIPHSNYMGTLYKLRDSKNVEVSSRYYRIEMMSGDTGIKGKVMELLGQVGRMKFVVPLFVGLIKMDIYAAMETFEKNKNFYHPICRAAVADELFGKKQQEGKEI